MKTKSLEKLVHHTGKFHEAIRAAREQLLEMKFTLGDLPESHPANKEIEKLLKQINEKITGIGVIKAAI